MLLTLPIREVLPGGARARIVRLDLTGRPFPYLPGQAVLVAFSGLERRPYSIAAAPDNARRKGFLELLVGVDEEGTPGGHLTLEPGALVNVEGPLGRFVFPDDDKARHVVFIAGGTGIAPLRAMLQQALATSDRHIVLVYSARTPRDFAYEGELRNLARAGRIDLNLTVTRDSDPSDWTGALGRLNASDLTRLVPGPAALCFICGPPTFVTDMTRQLIERGIPDDRIRKEHW
jgi:NAD(P)H-flavin reductase